MNAEPTVQPLPYERRTWFFRFLFLLFVLMVPAFIFYAAGYRISLSGEDGNIVTVGGMFISAETDNTTIFINDEPVDNLRVFQRAAYIQNVPAGTHQVLVQGEGVHTWVKELPVYSHIVTEAAAFNFPTTPQVRLITPFTAASGTPLIFGSTSTEPLGVSVQYREPVFGTSTRATSTFAVNAEYAYVSGLFAATSTASSTTLRERFEDGLERFTFSSSAPATQISTTSATTTRIERDRRLYEQDGEVYVRWEGNENAVPYYFCVYFANATTTAANYGAHVSTAIAATLASTGELIEEGQVTCRDTIKIDRKQQDVYLFDFFPDNTDLILMHLEDGLHVVEVDDRAWQNTQLLYPGTGIEVRIDGGQIFIEDDGVLLELLTTLE